MGKLSLLHVQRSSRSFRGFTFCPPPGTTWLQQKSTATFPIHDDVLPVFGHFNNRLKPRVGALNLVFVLRRCPEYQARLSFLQQTGLDWHRFRYHGRSLSASPFCRLPQRGGPCIAMANNVGKRRPASAATNLIGVSPCLYYAMPRLRANSTRQ